MRLSQAGVKSVARLLKGSLGGVYPRQPDLIKPLRSYPHSREDALPSLFISNRGLPLHRSMLWHLIKKKYATAARVDPAKVKFHSLKHSIATHLLDAGADLAFVKDWLGHVPDRVGNLLQ